MEEITNKVMESIKKKRIAPESSLASSLRKYVPWVLVYSIVSLGGIAMSVIFFSFLNSDLDLAVRLGGGFIFRSMPFFWIISFALFLILGKFTYGKTLFGYRNTIMKIALLYVLATLILGGIFVYMGVPSFVQTTVRGNGFVHNMMFTQTAVWSQPENGLLSGTIEGVDGKNIMLKDFSEKIWNIDIASTTIRRRVSLNTGEQIKILGTLQGDVFVADDIRPWVSGAGSGMGKGMGRGMMR